jgi:Tfp pilus assembly protein PilN
MSDIHIDFAPRSLRRSLHRTTRWTWLAAAVGLILCISAGIVEQMTLHKYQAQETATAELRAKLARYAYLAPAAPKAPISDAQANAVNHAIAQLNLPWRDILNALEAATPSGIALLAIEPDAKKNILKAMAEAPDSDAMIAYVENLKKQPLFTDAILTRHEINDRDPNRPLRFQFEVLWVEAAK